jgi:SpoVK/Ycf46/Vps4 family AAA+-type ATPase
MIGMQAVSHQLDGLIKGAIVDRDRAAKGYPVAEKTMHMVFSGPPGTGKTTIAGEIAPLYHALGLIDSEKVVAPVKSELIGEYAGETHTKTQKVLNRAHGGVLFIDEAYGLVTGKNDTFGREALNTLVEDMEKHRGDTVVILAGYPHEIDELVKINPGLRSRLPTTIHFPPYDTKASQRIGHSYVQQGAYRLAPGARAAYDQAIAQHATGNAREVRNLYEKIRTAQQGRLVESHGVDIPREAHPVLTRADVEAGTEDYLAGQGRPRRRGKLVKT